MIGANSFPIESQRLVIEDVDYDCPEIDDIAEITGFSAHKFHTDNRGEKIF